MNSEEIVFEIEAQLRQLGYEVNKHPNSELLFKTLTGQRHKMIIRFLNLDISKSPNQILIRNYLKTCGFIGYAWRVCSLIPDKVFETPNEIFIDNE